MNRLPVWIACGLALCLASASPAQVELVTPEENERIETAKEQLDTLAEYLGRAQEIPGIDDEIKDALENGADMAKYAKDGLETGVKTIEVIEKLIKLHATLDCISGSVACMQNERTPGCIRAYAMGMSELFTMLHDALADSEFEGEGALGSLAAMRVNFMIGMYVPALEVASETFTKAVKWGQICKTDAICQSLCSVEENRSVFDCAELLDEYPPMPPSCETLAMIIRGDEPPETAEAVVANRRERLFFFDHSSLVKLREDRKLVRTIIVRRDDLPQMAQLKPRFESAMQGVEDGYEGLEGMSEGPAAEAAIANLQVKGCEAEEVLAEVFAAALTAKQRIVSAMHTIDGIARCPRHEAILRGIR